MLQRIQSHGCFVEPLSQTTLFSHSIKATLLISLVVASLIQLAVTLSSQSQEEARLHLPSHHQQAWAQLSQSHTQMQAQSFTTMLRASRLVMRTLSLSDSKTLPQLLLESSSFVWASVSFAHKMQAHITAAVLPSKILLHC